ncbi:hypothetical protein KUCAC02_034337, partial [Chaenocephalus aceratus]
LQREFCDSSKLCRLGSERPAPGGKLQVPDQIVMEDRSSCCASQQKHLRERQ